MIGILVLMVNILLLVNFSHGFCPATESVFRVRTLLLPSHKTVDSLSSSFADDDAVMLESLWKESATSLDDSNSLLKSLREREKQLQAGMGKRFRCRTQKGFLNIHQEPGDPFDTHNIIGQLTDGQIVTSIAPRRGPWIRHDGGGWSIATFGGFTWLEEIQE